LKRFL